MKISILCSDERHPIYPFLKCWKQQHSDQHDIDLVEDSGSLHGGDILFLISCTEIMGRDTISRYKASLVIHESDLPKGRGWSPLAWQILEGRNVITISLLEAAEKVDSGSVWATRVLQLEGHELLDEINAKLFPIKLELMNYAMANFGEVTPVTQCSVKPTYYRKRMPEDSRIDAFRSIAQQFDLLRIADSNRYPAFFDFRGFQYKITLTKLMKS